jgi:hypothetical protein
MTKTNEELGQYVNPTLSEDESGALYPEVTSSDLDIYLL